MQRNEKTPSPPELLPVIITPSSCDVSRRTTVRIVMPSGISVAIESDRANYSEIGALLAMINS
jgi:hypothetical protein